MGYALWLCLLVCMGCAERKEQGYRIALDPTWHSVGYLGQESNLTAFTCELISLIAEREKIPITVLQRGWSDLVLGLHKQEYNAICSTMQPYLFYEKTYHFSELYLHTGSVLVTRIGNRFRSAFDWAGKVIGVGEGSNGAIVLASYPEIIQRSYPWIIEALHDLRRGHIEGALVDSWRAWNYTHNLFPQELTVATAPLTLEGIRLVGIKGESARLIFLFNRGLARLKKDGIYRNLANKWGVPTECTPLQPDSFFCK